jgi:CDP-ribitol ribitolphosphotransferase
LQWYTEKRDFYFDYEEFVPGKVAKNMSELIAALKSDCPEEKNTRFKKFNFDFDDGMSTKRIVDRIMG